MQISAMIRYELYMQWRRRLLPVLLLSILGIFLMSVLLPGTNPGDLADPYEGHPPDMVIEAPEELAAFGVARLTVGEVHTAQATIRLLWSLLFYPMLFSLMAPVVFVETIPRDRQIGVRALLDSLPIGHTRYLAGKLLSVWASLLINILVTFGFATVIGRAVVGPFDLGVYLLIWLVVMVPPIFATTTVTVLLAAGQPTRRRAVVVSIVLLPFYIAGQTSVLLSLTSMLSLINPLYAYFGLGWLFGLPKEPPTAQVIITLAVMAALMALSWASIWAWMRYRGGRS